MFIFNKNVKIAFLVFVFVIFISGSYVANNFYSIDSNLLKNTNNFEFKEFHKNHEHIKIFDKNYKTSFFNKSFDNKSDELKIIKILNKKNFSQDILKFTKEKVIDKLNYLNLPTNNLSGKIFYSFPKQDLIYIFIKWKIFREIDEMTYYDYFFINVAN